jgi:Dolichyl-phosphate-mannose-protein mannosyltransferase
MGALGIALIGGELLLMGISTVGWLLLLCAAVTAGFSAHLYSPGSGRKYTNNFFCPELIFLMLILFGLLLFFYRLTLVPPAVSGYEVNSGLSALQLMHRVVPDGGSLLWQAMERSYSGSATSPLFVYSVELLFRIGGVSLFTLRSAGVFWAMISLIILYHLVTRLFDRRTAQLSLFLATISPWFLSAARLGNYMGLSLCYFLLVLLLFFKGVAGSPTFFFLTGAVLACFSFFYIPVKVIFPLLILLFIHAIITGRQRRGKLIIGAALILSGFLLVSLLVGSPFGHISGVSVKNDFIGSPPGETGFDVFRGARDFYKNLQGLFYDLFYRSLAIVFPFPRTSLVNHGVFLLAWLGLGWSSGRLKNPGFFFLGAAVLVTLLPTLLITPAVHDQPIARRCYLLAPIIAVLAAVTLRQFLAGMRTVAPGWGAAVGTIALVVFLAGTGITNLNRYFNTPAFPGFAYQRIFAEEAGRLIADGYYLEIAESDHHQRAMIDFYAYPNTGRLAHCYRFVGINSGHGLKWERIGAAEDYRFWERGDLSGALRRASTREGKTAILFENELLSDVRFLLSEIREVDRQASVSPIIGAEGETVGYRYLIPSGH